MMTAHATKMEFQGGKRGAGWCVVGIDENGEEEPWQLSLATEQIAKSEQPESLNVEIVMRKDDLDAYDSD